MNPDLQVILSAAGNVQVVNGVSVRGRAWVDYHCRTGSELFGLHYTAFVAMARGLEVSSEVLEGPASRVH